MKKLLIIFSIFGFISSARAQQQAICCPDFTLQGLFMPCDTSNACSSEPGPIGGGNPNGGAPGRAITACKNQAHKYLVVPNLTGFTYTWTIIGGTPTSTTGNPVTITWGNSSQGFIQVIISNGNGTCKDTIRERICLLTGPTANISASPNPVCANQPVCFSSAGSTGAASYYWTFGDGSTSTLPNPCHPYTTPGVYTVTLTVSSSTGGGGGATGNRPDCGCTDTAQIKITVLSKPGIDIHSDDCRKMLCYGDTIKYCTSTPGCSSLQWITRGGRIINGQGTTCITVVWDSASVYPTTVTLNANCPNTCGNSATLNVPVLYPNLPIQGPNIVCPNAASTYYLPALPGTFYKWTISGGGMIMGVDSNHNVINVQWGSTPGGPFIITCNYNNPYSNCSGTDTIGVYIKPPFRINGPSPVCTNTTALYNVVGFGNANWTVAPNTGFTPPGPFTNVSNIALNWSVAGNYTIGAVPTIPANYCTATDSLKVIVNPTPVLNPISGPNIVCPNQLYTYSVTSNMAGGNYSWQFTMGTGNVSGYGPNNSNASVNFTGGGPWILQASQTVNGCTGSIILNISKEPAPTLPNTPITACIGGQIPITVASGNGPFTWGTSPNVSLINGQGTNTATYEIHGNGTITVSNCGGISNAVTVTASTPGPITILQTGSLCAGNLQLSAPLGTSYQWSGASNAVTQTINVTQPGTYIVQVTLANGCISVGTFTVPPVALPSVTISTGSPLVWCNPAIPNVLLQAFTLSTGCTYQWYLNNNSNPVGTNSATYTATSAGNYYVVITCGCVATSNVITVQQINCTSGGAGCNGPNPLGPITVTGCNPKTFTVTGSCTGGIISWNFGDGGNATGPSATHTYANTGAYPVTASITCNGCTYFVYTTAEVPVKADFNYSVVCGVNGNNTITLNNISQVLGGWTVTSVTWLASCGSPTSGAGNSFTFNTTGCSPMVTMNIIVTNTNTGQSCTDSKVFTFNMASASLAINGPTTVCANLPYQFNSSLTTGIIQYLWTVNGNQASQNNPLTFTFSGTPTIQTVALKVTDSYGCSFTTSINVTVITPPALTITPSPIIRICPDCTTPTVTLTANPSGSFTNYQWYHNGTAIGGANSFTYQPCLYDASGNYWVTANNTGAGNCPVVSDTVKVVYNPKPVAKIQGLTVQCQTGTGPYNINLQNSINDPNCTYNWTATGPGSVTFSPDNLQFYASATATQLGTYQFILTVTDITTGCIAKDTFCVYLYLSPTVNVICPTGPLCEGTPYTFTVTPVNPACIYTWSNGVNGPVMTTSQAGTYGVTATDTISGCSATFSSCTINKRPYVDLFPIGCDTLCDTAKLIPPLPLGPGQTYPGQYIIKWYVDGNLYFTGCPLLLSSLTLGQHQIYIVVTDIATQCTSTSGKYDLFIKHCGKCDCKESKWGDIILTEGDNPEGKAAQVAGNPKKLNCDKTYKIDCNKPYIINASYICKDTACAGKVTYSLQPPSGSPVTGSILPPLSFTPTLNGTYTLTLYGWCGDTICAKCIIKFDVDCHPCDCKGSKWGTKSLTINNAAAQATCGKTYDLKCKDQVSINANYICADTACNSAVTYSLVQPSGTTTGNVPVTFAANLPGTYTVTLYGWCGGKICDSCVISFKVGVCDEPCCPYTKPPITVTDPTIQLSTISNPPATVVNANFPISGPSGPLFTEIRAEVMSFNLFSNFNNECLSCKSYPYTWGSIYQAGNVGNIPPKITMYNSTATSFNPSGIGMYQNPREVIWSGNPPFALPNNINIQFLLPLGSIITCCELTANICVKFTFRDNFCKECEVIVCFKVVIKPGGQNDDKACNCEIKPVFKYESNGGQTGSKNVSCNDNINLFAGSIQTSVLPNFTCKDQNGKDCPGSSIQVSITKPDNSVQGLSGPNYNYTYTLGMPGVYEYTLTGICGGKDCVCKFKVTIPQK